MKANELIDKKELCQLLHLGKTTIENYQRKKLIPVIKCGTSRRSTVRYEYPEVVAALKKAGKM